MLTQTQARDAIAKTLYDTEGSKIGKIEQVYLDDTSGEPEFLTVNTGFFGTNESFVPAQDATVHEDGFTVPFSKEKVKDAPNVASDGHLEPQAEDELYAYYGLASGNDADHHADLNGTVETADRDTHGETEHAQHVEHVEHVEGHDTSGPTTDDAMTRSEEQLHVGTRSQQSGKARLRKYVTTEEQTVTVPVSKEYAVLESEPITDANADSALSGGDITSEEHEVLLNEEVVEVSKTVNPVERVRLGTETRTEDQEVTEEIRKENVDVEGEVEDRRA